MLGNMVCEYSIPVFLKNIFRSKLKCKYVYDTKDR